MVPHLLGRAHLLNVALVHHHQTVGEFLAHYPRRYAKRGELTSLAELTVDEHRRQLRRAVIASTIGTAIEWYDFFLYSIVTGLVFAQLYFPKSDPLVGTLQAFAIYAVGFVARPVGAAIFGIGWWLSEVR